MKQTKKTWITAYDFSSAAIAEHSQIDTLLVGDSLGMTVYGFENTRKVTVEMMLRHFEAVKKGAPKSDIVIDFPFGTTENILIARETAEIFANVGGNTFKLEGGKELLPIIIELMARKFEVVGHLGLTPQTSEWKVHGKKKQEADEILETIKSFDALGMKRIVLECVPAHLGKKAQEIFSGDIIGIGAGNDVNGQVLVFDDVIGRTDATFQPKFLRRFANAQEYEKKAVEKYISAVKNGDFPSKKEMY